jgi:glutamate racemase
MTKIGVFDSGIGGLSVVQAIQKALPHDNVVFIDDRAHMPYGDKSPQEVLGYVAPLLDNLVKEGCEVIVIACNTVTTTLIKQLRKKVRVPLVGIEPMVKPAAKQTKTGIIAVCATPATLASDRYRWLKETYASDVKVIEPDCSRWAYMIEHNTINEEELRNQIETICRQGVDVIVLGCTHYHWIEAIIQEIATDRAKVIQPEQAAVAQLKRVLAKLKADRQRQ